MRNHFADLAWREIVKARGHVQGKVFRMRADTLARILWGRGKQITGHHGPRNPGLQGIELYGVLVEFDQLMNYGEIRLEER